mmetsp:Transcript_5056/g.15999  ORF Transcript_5056/g.15999 Transcript_5056/m.15999 type:complete len:410 (+) Transcript_5056:826-2055(+)
MPLSRGDMPPSFFFLAALVASFFISMITSLSHPAICFLFLRACAFLRAFSPVPPAFFSSSSSRLRSSSRTTCSTRIFARVQLRLARSDCDLVLKRMRFLRGWTRVGLPSMSSMIIAPAAGEHSRGSIGDIGGDWPSKALGFGEAPRRPLIIGDLRCVGALAPFSSERGPALLRAPLFASIFTVRRFDDRLRPTPVPSSEPDDDCVSSTPSKAPGRPATTLGPGFLFWRRRAAADCLGDPSDGALCPGTTAAFTLTRCVARSGFTARKFDWLGRPRNVPCRASSSPSSTSSSSPYRSSSSSSSASSIASMARWMRRSRASFFRRASRTVSMLPMMRARSGTPPAAMATEKYTTSGTAAPCEPATPQPEATSSIVCVATVRKFSTLRLNGRVMTMYIQHTRCTKAERPRPI